MAVKGVFVIGIYAFMLLLGFIFIVIGASTFYTTVVWDLGDPKIRNYNNYVKTWTSSERAKFLGMTIVVTSQGGGGNSSQAIPNTSTDWTDYRIAPQDKTDPNIDRNYLPLKYSVPAQAVQPQAPIPVIVPVQSFPQPKSVKYDSSWGTCLYPTHCNYSVTVNNVVVGVVNFKPYNYVGTIMTNCNTECNGVSPGTFPDASCCFGQCAQAGGIYDYSANLCYKAYALNATCIKVAMTTTTQQPYLDPNNYACWNINVPSGTSIGLYNVTQALGQPYVATDPQSWGVLPGFLPLDIVAFNFRSPTDPIIYIYQTTQGSFALHFKEQKTIQTAAGGVLIGLGVIFLVVFAVLLGIYVHNSKAEKLMVNI
mmetsp:Transcript_46157/g.75316  ORF Transcript_46157/g.75316 Transcript_46157/m.75316 type:complete len:367 (-) Transcript_46157:225-1325(-)